MWSSLAEVVSWVEDTLEVRTGSYPPADYDGDFAIVQRVGGSRSYPHDHPRFAVQVWTDSDANGEQVVYALERVLPTLAGRSERILRIDSETTPTQLGPDENGHFVWQLVFTLHCNVLEED